MTRKFDIWGRTLAKTSSEFELRTRIKGMESIIFWGMTPCSRLKLNGLHGVISQKMILFITTSVKTSDPTRIKDVWKQFTEEDIST
jgi:hypothetical protein